MPQFPFTFTKMQGKHLFLLEKQHRREKQRMMEILEEQKQTEQIKVQFRENLKSIFTKMVQVSKEDKPKQEETSK